MKVTAHLQNFLQKLLINIVIEFYTLAKKQKVLFTFESFLSVECSNFKKKAKNDASNKTDKNYLTPHFLIV